jgi:hypothetical protein
MPSQNRQFATWKSVSFTRPLLRHASQAPRYTEFQPFRNQRGPAFQPESASRLDLATENRTNASITAEPWPDRTTAPAEGWPAAKSQQDLAILLAILVCAVRELFQQRIRAKHVKSNMHVAIMGKDPDFQVMRAIDILTDLQHQRHRVG